jgi:hypothetical protein
MEIIAKRYDATINGYPVTVVVKQELIKLSSNPNNFVYGGRKRLELAEPFVLLADGYHYKATDVLRSNGRFYAGMVHDQCEIQCYDLAREEAHRIAEQICEGGFE